MYSKSCTTLLCTQRFGIYAELYMHWARTHNYPTEQRHCITPHSTLRIKASECNRFAYAHGRSPQGQPLRVEITLCKTRPPPCPCTHFLFPPVCDRNASPGKPDYPPFVSALHGHDAMPLQRSKASTKCIPNIMRGQQQFSNPPPHPRQQAAAVVRAMPVYRFLLLPPISRPENVALASGAELKLIY